MADVSKIKLGSTTYDIKDGSAISNITRSGTTFTATKRDGTTFTFTQQDNNTTYSNATLGQGLAACDTAAATAAKTASITNYELTTGGVVTLLFTNGNTVSSPTLNINSKGAKSIKWHGSVLTDTTLIKAGDLVTFLFNGNYYHIISISPVTTGTTNIKGVNVWTANTPTAVTKKTVVTGTTATTISVSNGVLSIPASVLTNKSTGDSVTVTAGTAASLTTTTTAAITSIKS